MLHAIRNVVHADSQYHSGNHAFVRRTKDAVLFRGLSAGTPGVRRTASHKCDASFHRSTIGSRRLEGSEAELPRYSKLWSAAAGLPLLRL